MMTSYRRVQKRTADLLIRRGGLVPYAIPELLRADMQLAAALLVQRARLDRQ
jgi:hypothetical protein